MSLVLHNNAAEKKRKKYRVNDATIGYTVKPVLNDRTQADSYWPLYTFRVAFQYRWFHCTHTES